MSVIIKLPAFINMAASSIEVYKKEAYGFLLGKRLKGNYIVHHAILFQTARRDYEYITIDKHRENRINTTLRFLVKHKYIGDFHSHPDFPEKLSVTDKREIKKMGENIVSLLVVVKKSKKFFRWIYNSRDRSISGTVGDYFVKILAYEYNKKKDKIEKLSISCPCIKDINKIRKEYAKIKKRLDKLNKTKKSTIKMKKKLEKKLMLW